jgi:WD40 repeat protein
MNIKRTTLSRAIWPYLFIAGGLLSPVAAIAADAEKLGDLRGVFRANFNHDASRVVIRHRNGDVGIWEVPAGERIAGDLAPNTSSESYVMSPDGKSVLVGLKDGGARVFDATTAKAISPALEAPLASETQMPALFSPDGNTVLIFAAKEVAVFHVRDGQRVAALPLVTGPNEDEPGSAAFAAGGAQCFVMDGSGNVTRYDAREWKPMGKAMKHPLAESAYDFGFNASEDGKWLVTFDSPGENGPKGHLQVWDVAANKPVGKPVVAVNGLSGRFLGNNRILIAPGRGDATVRDLPSMKAVYSLRPHDDVHGPSVDISPDKKWILSWGPDRTLYLYDAATGKIATNQSPAATVSQVMMAPESSGCYILFENSAFLLQNHHDHYLIKMTFPELTIAGSVRILDFVSSISSLSPDGKRLLVIQGTTDQERPVFFDTATLKPLQ